ncbi:thiamine diphosphate-binding protein [Xylariales sp. PMI_506]|nr:thiamine diphosphate-binding protein [Xylariales sp. PMI_506]
MPDIFVGEYLFRRLREIEIKSVFGVPGDYELALLDLIEPEGLTWIGSPNELVASYAVDGYARIKGAGALVTTFGPGELSALCGVGGASCEFVPLVHIVGYPNDMLKKSGKIFHHTLGDGDYDHYIKMSTELSCATTVLKDASIAAAEIDRVLNAMLYHSQPVYIGIPEEIAYSKISDAGLSTPLVRTLAPNAADVEASVISAILAKLEAAKNPVILVDGGGAVNSWNHLADGLIEALQIPYFATPLGKGIANESTPLFGGSYVGAGSQKDVAKIVESSDCILWLGNYPSDFNTGIFTEKVNLDAVVDFQRFYTLIGKERYEAKMAYVLQKLLETLQGHPTLYKRGSSVQVARRRPVQPAASEVITQDWFWQRLTPYLRPGDLLVAETGTAQFGICETYLPEGAHYWTQAIYGSIGYAIGAAVGGSVASKETGKHKRMIVLTGEGSLQLTVQAFSLLNRHGITPVVFVINNKGYTVERLLHGWNASYNDVPLWDYSAIFEAMAPNAGTVKGFKVETSTELDRLLSDEAFAFATYPQCVDVAMDPHDIPPALQVMKK